MSIAWKRRCFSCGSLMYVSSSRLYISAAGEHERRKCSLADCVVQPYREAVHLCSRAGWACTSAVQCLQCISLFCGSYASLQQGQFADEACGLTDMAHRWGFSAEKPVIFFGRESDRQNRLQHKAVHLRCRHGLGMCSRSWNCCVQQEAACVCEWGKWGLGDAAWQVSGLAALQMNVAGESLPL